MTQTRRDALKTLAAAAVGTWTAGRARAASANETLNLACVGVGGRGAANVKGVAGPGQNLVAFADVDDARAAKTYDAHPDVRKFRDYRRMLDAVGGEIDGVVVSTPDHTHFHPGRDAIDLGKHLYLEKPLAHNVWETRTLTEFARRQGVATQLGMQRHALPNVVRVAEIVRSGLIGEVDEVISWVKGGRGMPPVPDDAPTPPATLDYELWQGPAAEYRPFHGSICPYGWRFWWDYGTGETGNWGCHVLDVPFWALELGPPSRVDAEGPPVDAERTPKSMRVTYGFPTSNQGRPVTLRWHHGFPEEVAARVPLDWQRTRSPASTWHTLFVGSDGMLLAGFNEFRLLPAERSAAADLPAPSLPRSPGFYEEWLAACRGGAPATCGFDYSGPLTEAVLLGNVAYRVGGFDWDAATLSTGSNRKAAGLLREPYAEGWEV